MEYLPNGTLEAQIKSGFVTSQKAWKYFRGIILGLDYCHEKANVVHRDIKPENILIDINDNIKIADFGVSFMMDYTLSDEMRVMAGSHYFMAPEVISQERYKGKPSDIWATGVTLYYLLSRKLPFEGKNIQQLYQNIATKEPTYDALFTTEQANLLRKMLCKNPDQRCILKDILNDPWLTKGGAFPMTEGRESPIVITYIDRMVALTQLKIISHIKNRLHKNLMAVRKKNQK